MNIIFLKEEELSQTYLSALKSDHYPNPVIQYRLEDSEFDPIHVEENGNWIDLKCAKDVTIDGGKLQLVNLGIAMKLPKGYEAHLAPRSSTFKKYKVLQANSVGIIDNSYCGNNDIWRFPAYAVVDTIIKKGERIAQFRLVKTMEQEIKENKNKNSVDSFFPVIGSTGDPALIFLCVQDLNSPDRGGFGSTGTI